jgi:hypothetical protein
VQEESQKARDFPYKKGNEQKKSWKPQRSQKTRENGEETNKLNREKRFTPHSVVDDLFAVSDKVFCHCFLRGIDRNCHITTCELTGSTNQTYMFI